MYVSVVAIGMSAVLQSVSHVFLRHSACVIAEVYEKYYFGTIDFWLIGLAFVICTGYNYYIIWHKCDCQMWYCRQSVVAELASKKSTHTPVLQPPSLLAVANGLYLLSFVDVICSFLFAVILAQKVDHQACPL